MQILGLNEKLICFQFPLILSLKDAKTTIQNVIAFVHMTLDGTPDITIYPNQDGKGGEGLQIYQKLVESFMVIGTWPAHKLTRIYLASCTPFEVEPLTSFLSQTLMVRPTKVGYFDF
jgi:hypothetical protein